MKEKDIIQLFYKDNIDILDDCSAFSWNEKKFHSYSPSDQNHPSQLVSTDTLIENIHFSLKWSNAKDLAIKLFQVNLSDLISSGAEPIACTINLGIPIALLETDTSNNSSISSNLKSSFIEEFAFHFVEECKKYNCLIIGGDSTRSSHLYLSLSMFGQIKNYWPRTAGKVQDNLYITGNLGLSLLAWRFLNTKVKLPESLAQKSLDKHLRPLAPYSQFNILKKNKLIHAGIDISDGLWEDAQKLARASNLQLEIEVDKIPVLETALPYLSHLDILASGEELELLFLASPDFKLDEGLDVHCIGKAFSYKDKTPFVIYKNKGEILQEELNHSKFWKHF